MHITIARGGEVTLKKPTPHRDPRYLVWIRTLPCLCCQGWSGIRIDPHHMDSSGIGTKGSDHLVIPLCRRCHVLVQTKDWKALARWGFTIVTAWEGAARLIVRFFDDERDSERREHDRA